MHHGDGQQVFLQLAHDRWIDGGQVCEHASAGVAHWRRHSVAALRALLLAPSAPHHQHLYTGRTLASENRC